MVRTKQNCRKPTDVDAGKSSGGMELAKFPEIQPPQSPQTQIQSSESEVPSQETAIARRLIADESIEFVASISETLESYLGKWIHHDEGNAPRWCNISGQMRRKYFEFNFGVRATDGNVYPFTLTLFRLEKWWLKYQKYWECGDFITLWPTKQHSITAEVEVTIDDQTFSYTESFEEGGTKNPDFGRGDPSRPGDKDGPHRWRVERLSYSRKSKIESERTCKVGAKIKIYKHEDCNVKNEAENEDVGNFTIACRYYDERKNQDRYKEFYLDKNVFDERSNLLKTMGSKKSKTKKAQPNKIVLDGIDVRTLEAYITFCKTGYFPLWAIDGSKSNDGDLITLADKYNLTEISDLVDKYVAMTITAENADDWVDWCVKMDLKNVALRILGRKKAVAKIGGRKKKIVKKINGVKPEEVEWSNFCKEHQRFISYLGYLAGIVDGLVPDHGRFEALINFTENIMVN